MKHIDRLSRLLLASRYDDFRHSLSLDHSAINEWDSDNQTLLHLAIAWKHPKAVRILIAAGADVNRVDGDNCTPLVYAVSHRDEASAMALLDAGADHSIKDNHGNGPLWTAVIKYQGGEGKVIRALLQAGADRHSVNKYGKTPLQLAMSINSSELHAMFV